jgi:hypothetical protein
MGRPAEIPQFDIAKPLMQAAQLRQMGNESRLSDFALAKAQREEADDAALRKAYAGALETDTSGNATINRSKMLSEYGKVAPMKAVALGQQYQKADADTMKAFAESKKLNIEAQKTQTDTLLSQNKLVNQVTAGILSAPPQDRQRAYELGIGQLAHYGIPNLDRLPQAYDEGLVQRFHDMSLDTASKLEQYKIGLEQSRLEETARHQRASEALQGQGYEMQRRGQDIGAQTAMAGHDVTMRGQDITARTAQQAREAEGPEREARIQKLTAEVGKLQTEASGQLTPADRRKVELQIRGDIRQEPKFKTYSEVQNGVQNVQVGAKLNSAQGDLAIINGIAKIMDPNSTVREGEFATVQSAQGFFQQMRNLPAKWFSGDRLSPEVREKMLALASEISVEKTRAAHDELRKVYEPITQRAGVSFDELVPLTIPSVGATKNQQQPGAGQARSAPPPSPTATSAPQQTINKAQIAAIVAHQQSIGDTKTPQEVIDALIAKGYKVQ